MSSSYTYRIKYIHRSFRPNWHIEFVKPGDEMFDISFWHFEDDECSIIGYYDRYDYFTLSGEVERVTESFDKWCESLEEAIAAINHFVRLNGRYYRPLVEHEHLVWAKVAAGDWVEPGCEFQPKYTRDELEELEGV